MEEEYLAVLPEQVETRVLHGYLLGAVGPRPIAFASTVDGEGRPNLAPFSFFNVFSANPPVLIFSPARRVRDNTTKHTLENVQQTGEVVVNVVSYPMVQQMSLASTEYDRGVNEFEKAGFTMVPSDRVAPYRVGEAPVQFECRVTKVEPLGSEGGAGNLIHAEVLKIHIRRSVLDERDGIDPRKLDLVARMGGDWYTRAASGLFEVPKPLASRGIGVDVIPGPIRLSPVLTGNDLGLLGNVEALPGREEVRLFVQAHGEVRELLKQADSLEIHRHAQRLLEGNDVASAWKVLLASLEN
ncbi:flavin reductase family protein [Robiginitalea marina]|uniref:Flavin reductase family protein n=1 Tax=Robiginitalea marina TaxID=2954105 RepID=A0ABT1AWV4_9FLAO|nr:flavin reductase family protein [Robiginitalea marina]MCO5724534.1 flavin reductase family protein [Robiginitalea marina]